MQQGNNDYSSQYYPHHPYPIHPNPNPTPIDFNPNPIPNPIHPPFASAPPYNSPYQHQPEFTNYPPNPYPSYTAPPPPPPPPPEPQFPHDPYYYDYNPTPPPYENPNQFDQGSGGGYFGSFGGDGLGDGSGIYAYDGGKAEPYGARGTGEFGGASRQSSSELKFDDFGRPIGSGGGSGGFGVKEQPKIVRAVPKMESEQDVKNGVQKFRVKLLPEGSSVTTTDVLCQIGLDGIRMLDPSTSRTLRIYPLENVTRWEVLDSNIFAFWSKSPVDYDARRIRLQSNSYTTSTILDTVTAATVQLKEMGGKDSLARSRTADTSKPAEQTAEKKKGLTDWINIIKPGNEEKDHWVPDEAVTKCTFCTADFGAFNRRHHCRNCGDIFCDKCTQGRIALTTDEQAQAVRVCDSCLAEVSQRLTNEKERPNSSTIHSHEDLARKLQEELERNRKSSIGSKSSVSSGKQMREVACPTCTVHLQVQVPASGSETIECGVCQQPFLVSAH